MAADPDRPFACWSIPAQLIAICLLEEFVDDDHIWGQISNRKLVDSDDRNVIRDLLDRPADPLNGPRAAGRQRASFRTYCRIIEKTMSADFSFQTAV
jgi:hypothetical protein